MIFFDFLWILKWGEGEGTFIFFWCWVMDKSFLARKARRIYTVYNSLNATKRKSRKQKPLFDSPPPLHTYLPTSANRHPSKHQPLLHRTNHRNNGPVKPENEQPIHPHPSTPSAIANATDPRGDPLPSILGRSPLPRVHLRDELCEPAPLQLGIVGVRHHAEAGGHRRGGGAGLVAADDALLLVVIRVCGDRMCAYIVMSWLLRKLGMDCLVADADFAVTCAPMMIGFVVVVVVVADDGAGIVRRLVAHDRVAVRVLVVEDAVPAVVVDAAAPLVELVRDVDLLEELGVESF